MSDRNYGREQGFGGNRGDRDRQFEDREGWQMPPRGEHFDPREEWRGRSRPDWQDDDRDRDARGTYRGGNFIGDHPDRQQRGWVSDRSERDARGRYSSDWEHSRDDLDDMYGRSGTRNRAQYGTGQSGERGGYQGGGSQFGEDARRQGASHRGRGPKNYRRSDDRIREDVCDRLSDDDDIDASGIEVSVSEREVTLSGEVDSKRAKRIAEDCADAVSGVNHVQNNLRVKADTGGRDAAQEAKAKNKS